MIFSKFARRLHTSIATIIVLSAAIASANAQEGARAPLRRLESEMIARASARANAVGGFRLDTADFDVRLPISGEPEEIVGPTIHANDAFAVGSARIEPLDTVVSRSGIFNRARYEFRLEDRSGGCLIVHQDMRFESKVVTGPRSSERCQTLYMADVVRRNRRVARLPLSAGRVDDHWSAALAANGIVDVYLDSVVVTTSSMILRASYPIPESDPVVIDSLSAGLGTGDESWSVVRHSAPLRVDTTLYKGGEWRRSVKRFVIPIDSTFALEKSWPLFEVYLKVPKTKDNPYGVAWTYAHERKGFFANAIKR